MLTLLSKFRALEITKMYSREVLKVMGTGTFHGQF